MYTSESYKTKYILASSILQVIVLLMMSLILTQFIQIRTGNPSFIADNTVLFIYSEIIILFAILFFAFLAENLYLGIAIFTAILIGFTFGDANKYIARVEHTFPADFVTITNIGGMGSMYSKSALAIQIVFIMIVLAVGFTIKRLMVRQRKKLYAQETENCDSPASKQMPKSKKWLIKIGLALATLIIIILIAMPLRVSDEVKLINFEYKYWNQIDNFNDNGYVAAFISNFRNPFPKPEGYSKEKIAEITDKYKAIADQENKTRIDLSGEDIDIIYVMNESFTDIESFKDVYPFDGGAVTPNLHDINAKTLHGSISSPQYGGGTSNVEFEALTGLSMYYLGVTIPFQDTIPKQDAFPSLPYLLKNDYGYSTVAMHPFGKGLYSRESVYPIMGIDTFLGEEDFYFKDNDRTAWYISDESSYKELEKYLDSDDENKFVHLVTMQNHQLYGDQYNAHNFSSQADTTEGEKNRINDYMELLHSSDSALTGLIDMIDKRSKKTMVVFWGDHLPGVYPDLLEGDDGLAFKTPFFIYSNFKEEKGDVGTISPNYISSETLDYIGAKKPPFYYLLDDMKKENPIFTSIHFNGDKPNQSEVLSDYEMIQYDIMRGNGYSKQVGIFSFS